MQFVLSCLAGVAFIFQPSNAFATDEPITLSGKVLFEGTPREGVLVAVYNVKGSLPSKAPVMQIEVQVADIAKRPNIALQKNQPLLIKWPKAESHSFSYWSSFRSAPGALVLQMGSAKFQFDWTEENIHIGDAIDPKIVAYVVVLDGESFCYTSKDGSYSLKAPVGKESRIRFYCQDRIIQQRINGMPSMPISVDFIATKKQ